MGDHMKTLQLWLGVALLALVGCGGNSTTDGPIDKEYESPIRTDIAYHGTAGTLDSAGKNVPARMLILMKSDSSFRMYLSPSGLPLYHSRSKFDLVWLKGQYVKSEMGTMFFSVDSTRSFWSDGTAVRRGTVQVFLMDPSNPSLKYVIFQFLSRNENGLAKLEHQVWRADSNMIAQYQLEDGP